MKSLYFLILSQTPQVDIKIPTEADIGGLSDMMKKAVMDKNWFMLSGVLLMFTMILLNKVILPRIISDEKFQKYKPYIPLVTFAISIGTGIATWILNPQLDLVQILMTSGGATLVASGSWESLIKPVTKIKKKKVNPEEKSS